MSTLRPQSNGPLYKNTVIGTPGVMGGLLHLVQRGRPEWTANPPSPIIAGIMPLNLLGRAARFAVLVTVIVTVMQYNDTVMAISYTTINY